MLKIVFSVFTSLLPCFKVKGQGQGQRSRSNCLRAAVNIRGPVSQVQQRLKKSHYQSEGFVCVLNNLADAVDQLFICNF